MQPAVIKEHLRKSLLMVLLLQKEKELQFHLLLTDTHKNLNAR